MMYPKLLAKNNRMISIAQRETSFFRALSDLEEIELVQSLSLMKTTLDVFPESSVSQQTKINEWARLEQWALLAIKTISRLLKQLAPLQSRSDEAEQAFGATLEAYDLVSDIVERRFTRSDSVDFTAARRALEQCFCDTHRLI